MWKLPHRHEHFYILYTDNFHINGSLTHTCELFIAQKHFLANLHQFSSAFMNLFDEYSFFNPLNPFAVLVVIDFSLAIICYKKIKHDLERSTNSHAKTTYAAANKCWNECFDQRSSRDAHHKVFNLNFEEQQVVNVYLAHFMWFSFRFDDSY